MSFSQPLLSRLLRPSTYPSPEKTVGRYSAIASDMCGALIIGYYMYVDCKQQSNPNFKNRLENEETEACSGENCGLSNLLDLKDADAVRRFFFKKIEQCV